MGVANTNASCDISFLQSFWNYGVQQVTKSNIYINPPNAASCAPSPSNSKPLSNACNSKPHKQKPFRAFFFLFSVLSHFKVGRYHTRNKNKIPNSQMLYEMQKGSQNQESKFFNDGLALAPDGGAGVPLILPCRPRLVGGSDTGVSSTRGTAGDACVVDGDGTGALRTRSVEYIRGGGPFNALIECCGDWRTIVACTSGGDAEEAYGRGPATGTWV